MNKQTEALKMAIEAMSCISQSRGDPLLKAIRACKEALEQPARLVSYAPDKSTCTLNIDGEEVYFNREQPASKNIRESFNEMLDDKVAYYKGKQPAQEPWGWYGNHDIYDEKQSDESIALYTHPCAPSWQGLTSEEIRSLDLDNDVISVIFQTEKLLKEKNYV